MDRKLNVIQIVVIDKSKQKVVGEVLHTIYGDNYSKALWHRFVYLLKEFGERIMQHMR